jgi:hypothetical protein
MPIARVEATVAGGISVPFFARNAVDLLKDDIGVLLLALEQSTAEWRDGSTRAAA